MVAYLKKRIEIEAKEERVVDERRKKVEEEKKEVQKNKVYKPGDK